MHPEVKKNIEVLHYHLEHNLPVKRILLYEVVPELFQQEIDELDEYERERILAKRPVLKNEPNFTVQTIDSPPEKRDKNLHPLEELKKQEYEFREFEYKKASDFMLKHEEHIEAKFNKGFHSLQAILENIEVKPAERLTEEEKVVLADLHEMKQIHNDYTELIKLNKIKTHKLQRELSEPPEFIKQSDILRKVWYEKWEQIMGHSIDLRESMFVPESNWESQLDKVMKEQRSLDIQELIQLSQSQYKEVMGGDDAPPPIDRNQKNPELVRQVEALGTALHMIPPKVEKSKRPKLDHFQKGIGREEMPEEKMILVEEISKVLYLNNLDPKKYTIKFWSEHFNIEPQRLRNIFNYLSYAIIDEENPRETGRILRFIYETEDLKSKAKKGTFKKQEDDQTSPPSL
jgi:hypothetical protein